VLRRGHSIIGLAAVVCALITSCSNDSDSERGSNTVPGAMTTTPEASAEFCAFGERFVDRGTAMAAAMDSTDAALLQSATDETTTQLEGMTASAPGEIADDLAVVRSLYAEFVAVLKGGNYDLVALSTDPAAQAVVDKLNDPQATTASTRLDAFLTDACGITTES
jgi:hypothetical protein